ncbi:MAG: PBP1A family penicillin-binding protein, partial [Deltaproteobacteria bacterium]|nr:PBP1A family penicillin-binding protein [Deltaproteobacteria bacterium]
EIAAERRTVVPFARIPKLLVKAVVAAEDGHFYKHRGLDYLGMLRAFFANVRAGRFAQGGSTITQQLIKTYFLTASRTIKRKMQEVILARQLENELSKDEILHLYLNQIYFGHGRYGVQEASRFYFGKDVSQLGLAECAMMAGLPQSPERLSPVKHPKRAKRRQTYVLRQMARHHFISEKVSKKVVQDPIRITRRRKGFLNAAPEYTDLVRARLVEEFGEKKLPTLGTVVTAAVDVKLQVAAREALEEGLRALDRRQGLRHGLRKVKPAKRAKLLRRLAKSNKRLEDALKKRRSRVDARNYRGLVVGIKERQQVVEVDLGHRKVSVAMDDKRYNPQGEVLSRRFAVGDLLRLQATKTAAGDISYGFAPGPQGALIAIDPRSGEVLALVGGYRFRPGGFNRALRAKRQPGSTFKPFVYGAALESKRYTPATIVNDTPIPGGWNPQNFDRRYRGPMRLRVALAHSVNTIAGQLILALGVDSVRSFAYRMGISSKLSQNASIALGTSEVLPVELASAYATIANGGQRISPFFIKRIGKHDATPSQRVQVLAPEVAYVLTQMMRSVVEEGTARRARRLGRPVAGKTGTTNEQQDAWFVGFTPQLVTAVWVGYDRRRKGGLGRKETGGRAALPIWVRFMRKALRHQPKLPFAQPPKVVVHRIDPVTGLLAAPNAADAMGAIEEVFVEGTEPKETASTPDQVDPNSLLMGGGLP